MTRAQAISKAADAYNRTGVEQYAIVRTDHPHVNGDYCYVIAVDAKHAWTKGETVLYDTRHAS